MNKRFTSTVAGASIFITITGLISKGLGFFREIIYARSFGLSSDFDIYLIGAVLPITINTIVLYLALNYLIPACHNIREKDPSQEENFLGINLIVFFTGGLILSFFLWLLSDPIIGFYLHNASPENIAKAKNIFLLFLITIPLNSIVAVISAKYQLNFKFNYPAYAQLMLNAIVIVLVLVFTNTLSIYSIPVAYIVGTVCQVVFIFSGSGIKIKTEHLAGLINDLKKYIPASLLVIIAIEAIGQLYTVVDRYFYNYVPAGGIAALNYAQTVFVLPISILSAALSTAIFPKFAHYISANLTNDLEELFNKSIKINLALFVPITVVFLFYGDFIIKIIFERGRFSASDTLLTFNALFWFSLSLVFYSVYGVMNKILYSMGLVKTLLYITVAGIMLKIILNILLVGKMYQDGLALSTSLSYLMFFAACIVIIYRKFIFKRKVFLRELSFQILNAFISFVIVKTLIDIFPRSAIFLCIEPLLFIAVFLGNIYFSGHSSHNMIIEVMKGLRKKPSSFQ